MDLYVTPDRYRALGTGVDLSGVTDEELHARLLAASMAVNESVNAPEGYSFLGGTVIDEEHLWNTRPANRVPDPRSSRIWVYNRPLRSVSGVRVNVTRTQYVDFTDEQVFIAHDQGYVEPVAAPNTTALFTSVPPWLLSSPVAYVSYDYGWDFQVTDETPTTLSGGSLRAAYQFWFTDEDVVLKKNGVTVDPDDYTVDYVEGTITPDSPDENAQWLVSYSYKLPPGVASATALIASDLGGAAAIAAAGMLGLSGIKVEEIELRQSSKVNFYVNPINAAAQVYLAPYKAMFTTMR